MDVIEFLIIAATIYSLYFKLIEIDTGKPISEKIMDVDVS